MSDRCEPIAVFAGPTLAGVPLPLPFVRHPPAGAGDLLRLLAGPPRTVLLVDGDFGHRSAVWHKEVLALMAAGFWVVGAASMGALRAAELGPFGMVGVGAVYRAYARGRLTGDDEVAVLHAPAEFGFAPLSVAQVDVRATLASAVRRRVLPVAVAREVRALSGALFFADRTWPGVLAAAAAAALPVEPLAAWLPDGAVSVKRADAAAGLACAAGLAPTAPTPGAPPPLTPYLAALARYVGVALAPNARARPLSNAARCPA